MEKPTKQYIERLLKEYQEAKEFADRAASRSEDYKKELTSMVKSFGMADEKGHKWLPGEEAQVKYERRVSRRMNLTEAEKWARGLGIWDQIKEIIEVTNEDNVLKYGWENPEHNDTISGFFEEKESWAFKIVNTKSYDDED